MMIEENIYDKYTLFKDLKIKKIKEFIKKDISKGVNISEKKLFGKK